MPLRTLGNNPDWEHSWEPGTLCQDHPAGASGVHRLPGGHLPLWVTTVSVHSNSCLSEACVCNICAHTSAGSICVSRLCPGTLISIMKFYLLPIRKVLVEVTLSRVTRGTQFLNSSSWHPLSSHCFLLAGGSFYPSVKSGRPLLSVSKYILWWVSHSYYTMSVPCFFRGRMKKVQQILGLISLTKGLVMHMMWWWSVQVRFSPVRDDHAIGIEGKREALATDNKLGRLGLQVGRSQWKGRMVNHEKIQRTVDNNKVGPNRFYKAYRQIRVLCTQVVTSSNTWTTSAV